MATNVKKTITIGGIVVAAFTAVYFSIKGIKSYHAIDKLDYDIDGFTLKEIKKNPIGIPTSLVYTISLKLNNPTDQDLVISKPYFTISIKKPDGSLAKIFNTATPDSTITNIKAKASTILKHDIELQVSNVAPVIPGFLMNLLARTKQQIVVDALIDSSGITFPIQQIISI